LPMKDDEFSHEFLKLKLKRIAGYINSADTCGLFKGKERKHIIAQMRSTMDSEYYSAIAECKACWFFNHKLGYVVSTKPAGIEGKSIDLKVGNDLYVEVKAPFEKTVFGLITDNKHEVKLYNCMSNACEKFKDRAKNILFIVAKLAVDPNLIPTQIRAVLFGELKKQFILNSQTGIYSPTGLEYINPTGLFYLKNKKDSEGTKFERISMLIFMGEHGQLYYNSDKDETQLSFIIYHNPNAKNPINLKIFQDYPQLYVNDSGKLKLINGTV